jgi:S1-C subfamily serine protease
MSRDWVPKPQRVQEPDVRGAEAEPRLQPKPSSTGTGFLVSQDGNVITNRHVVSGCSTLVAVNTNHREPLSVVAIDRNADLALLKMGFSSPAFASIGNTPSVRPGESVTVVGFPLWGILGSDAVISVGNVSSLTGPGDDRQLLQITAPIQPGSSGSPVLASNGEVVGVVVGKLHLKTVPEAVVPENVNFAIKAAAVCSFLQANGIRCSTGSAAQKLDSASVAERARGFTVAVECWK